MRKIFKQAGFWARWALLAVVASLVAACAQGPTYPPAPKGSANEGYNYIVGPGDSLNIIVWRNPELSMSVPVRPDGKLTTPLVEELLVQGKTSVEIARDVEKALSKKKVVPIVLPASGKRFNCISCPYETNDHNSFRRHNFKHSDDSMYKCPFCEYNSIQSTTYRVSLFLNCHGNKILN